MKIRFMAVLIMLFSTHSYSYPGWDDFTDSFASSLANQIVGMRSGKGPTTISSRCKTRVLGRCIVEETIRAQGHVSIGEQIDQSGVIMRQEVYDPVHNEYGYNYASSLYLEFKYTSKFSPQDYFH